MPATASSRRITPASAPPCWTRWPPASAKASRPRCARPGRRCTAMSRRPCSRAPPSPPWPPERPYHRPRRSRESAAMTDDFDFHPAPDAGVGELGGVLQATLPLLSQLLEAVPARVVVIDVNERLVWANHEFFKFTGLHPKQ